MKTLFLKKELKYTGDQLRSLFLYEQGLRGEQVAMAWVGACDVSLSSMVDAEDRVKKESIYSESMVHVAAEFFHRDVFFGVFVQRMLAEEMRRFLFTKTGQSFVRKGDDVYLGEKKLNVSIATVSPLSSLVHFAVNVSSKNTPVPTVGLEDLKLNPIEFANHILDFLKAEVESIYGASCKVFSV